ncbi:hypothetical protein NitYY0826_C1592 [Nitratiruptor sp. YY08-26]|uniref:phosphoethanolamine transferase n=1 Tax=unclassified Nitratiruptor TaxID=2624044 RepID=UPI0019161DB0|nr:MULTISPECIES: phosphoethanolamine transferase [unclassified Nitratiruptor]BCD62709.1 hypothetical protein NitYY0813_C1590 [Nitratiruptor sp. YY08-13]BCD66645.1 hypothetical protein NitYY0826_C1592 [Nitratiruptor sp. YY08-26]
MLKRHFINAIILTILFLFPDIVFMLTHKNFFVFVPSIFKELAALYLLSFLILAVQKYWIRLIFALFIATLSFVQLFHFSYFHSYLMPYEIGLADQIPEIIDTLANVIRYTYMPLILYFIQMVALSIFLKRAQAVHIQYIPLLIVLLLLIGPISAIKRKRAYIYLPKATSFSFKNTYNALSWYIAKEAFKKQNKPHFKPYKVTKLKKPLPQNIIVVMGESLNAKYMSLFGYPKESTPYLDKLKFGPNFHYTWGYSAGVTTDVSVPTFFALKREPQNITPLVKPDTNLLHLAKEQDYKTHYITTQNLFVIGGVLSDFSDVTKVFHGYDELLANYLNTVDFNRSNFIILHQRNSHSPYEKYTPPRFYHFQFKDLPYKEYMRGSYLNSVRYTDYILHTVFQKADMLPGCNVVFFTSDHGEMMGDKDEGGRFGHVYLGFADAKVPLLIYYTKSCPVQITKDFNLSSVISHYQFGKIIARTLGFAVNNPNEDGSYYINGVGIAGEKGFLRYTKKGKLQ